MGTMSYQCTFVFKRHFTFFLVYSCCFPGLYFLIVILLLEPKNMQRSPKMGASVVRQSNRSSKARRRWCFQVEGGKAVITSSLTQLPSLGRDLPWDGAFPYPTGHDLLSYNTNPTKGAPPSAGEGMGCAFPSHQVLRSTFFSFSQGH